MPIRLAAAISPADLIGCQRHNHFVDPRSVAADRFEFRTQLGLVHAARSDDLQILLVAGGSGAGLGLVRDVRRDELFSSRHLVQVKNVR
jgi:hypothetical protein